MYYQLARYDDAIEAYHLAIKIDPENTTAPHFWAGLGDAYGGLKRYSDAIEAYSQAIKIDPKDAMALQVSRSRVLGYGQPRQSN